MIKKFLVILALMFTFCVTSALAAAKVELKFNEYVSDGAYLFTDTVVENMNRTIRDLKEKTGAEIAVVTLKELGGATPDDLKAQIDKVKPLGDPKKHNGAVFLIGMKEFAFHLFLDSGFEKVLKPEDLQKMADEEVLPYFNSGEYDKGFVLGVYRLADLIAKADNKKIQHFGIVPPSPKKQAESKLVWLWLLIIPVLGAVGGVTWYVIEKKREAKEEEQQPQEQVQE